MTASDILKSGLDLRELMRWEPSDGVIQYSSDLCFQKIDLNLNDEYGLPF
jgi:hypothetical protein